jgi:hypothetical protein
MEPESSSPHLQEAATCLSWARSVQSRLLRPSCLLKIRVLYRGRYLQVSRAELLSCWEIPSLLQTRTFIIVRNQWIYEQMNPVDILISILQSRPRSSKWSISYRFPNKISVWFLLFYRIWPRGSHIASKYLPVNLVNRTNFLLQKGTYLILPYTRRQSPKHNIPGSITQQTPTS